MVNVILGHQGWRAVAVGLVVARVVALKLEDEHVAAVDDGSDGLVVRQAADLIVSVAEASGGKCTSVLMFWAVALEMVAAAIPAAEILGLRVVASTFGTLTKIMIASAPPAFFTCRPIGTMPADVVGTTAREALKSGVHDVRKSKRDQDRLECKELKPKATACVRNAVTTNVHT